MSPIKDLPTVKVKLSTAPTRTWAQKALRVVASTSDPVLIEACPGAGKTRFALEAAARMFDSGEINRLLIVVPSRRLVEQWCEASTGVGGGASIPLAPSTWRHPQPMPDGICGGVITYQSLFAQPNWWAAFAAEPGYRALVIFDEIHHAGTESGWGIASQEVFAHWAKRVICLTGTAFRTKDQMAFVRTVAVDSIERRSVADFTYNYGDALKDEICRPIYFEHIGGTATFQVPDGSVQTVTTDDDLNPRGESYRLRTLLDASGGHIREMIDVGDSRLARIRATGDNDAAGLIICIDCDHADAIANILTERSGVRPVVVCSRSNNPDDPIPADGIEKFVGGSSPWIIAVRMVSEGVDIRRLRVLIYATNVIAELTFRQIAGRIVRSDTNNPEDFGVMVIPSDRRLQTMADHITGPAMVNISGQLVQTASRSSYESIEGLESYGSFAPIDSTGVLEFVTHSDGRRAPAELVRLAALHVERTGSPVLPFEIAVAALNDPKIEESLRRSLNDPV
jgi:superfamily II DNA or RNA helicase